MERRSLFLVPSASILVALAIVSVASQVQSATHRTASTPPSPQATGQWYSTKWGQSFRPNRGYVSDQKTAIEVAKAIMLPIYGEKQIKSEEPFRASLDGNVWTVKGALPQGPGGNSEVKLSKSDGTVLYVSHTQ
jgi:hypothetical protein